VQGAVTCLLLCEHVGWVWLLACFAVQTCLLLCENVGWVWSLVCCTDICWVGVVAKVYSSYNAMKDCASVGLRNMLAVARFD
jgi:hypothetical protein